MVTQSLVKTVSGALAIVMAPDTATVTQSRVNAPVDQILEESDVMNAR